MRKKIKIMEVLTMKEDLFEDVAGTVTDKEPNALMQVINNEHVEPQTGLQIKESFMPFFDQAEELKAKALTIKVTDIGQKAEMLEARTIRLKLKDIRVNADKTRKDLKEDSLRYGKAVQGVYNIIEYLIIPIEKHLQEQEKFAEVQESKRQAEVKEKRIAELDQVSEFVPMGINLATMTDDDYVKLLNGAMLQYKAKLDAEAKEELERIQRIEAEEIESKRVIAENEKLKAEREAQEKAMAAEREKAEKERIAAEQKAAKERAAQEAIIKAEREAKEKLENEIKANAEQERKDKEQAAKIENDRLIALAQEEEKKKSAPDKIKLLALADLIDFLEIPNVLSENALLITRHTKDKLTQLASIIREQANKL